MGSFQRIISTFLLSATLALAGCMESGGLPPTDDCAQLSLPEAPPRTFDATPDEVLKRIRTLIATAISKQNTDGSWRGTLESHPAADVLFLLMAKKIGKSTDALEAEVMDRVFAWKGKRTAWGFVPSDCHYDPSLTQIILLGMSEFGVDREDSRVRSAWQWLDKNQSPIDLSAKLLLSAVDLWDSGLLAAFTPQLFGLTVYPPFTEITGEIPLNIHTMGVARNLLVPLVIQQFYRTASFPSELDRKRLKSAGRRFATDEFHLSDFWAQEGIGWILDHQQSDGLWYTFQITYLNILALFDAQERGVADFSDEIDRAWQGIHQEWRRIKDKSGSRYIEASQSDGWDTPLTLTAISSLPQEIWDESVEENLARGASWLLDKQIRVKGDWAYLRPDVKPGGWSFVPNNPFLPDTDVTGTSLDALALIHQKLDLSEAQKARIESSIQDGVKWLLGLQQQDGGFGSWEAGNTPIMRDLLKKIRGAPEFDDLGQPEVTARIAKVFKRLQQKNLSLPGMEKAIRLSCRFMKRSQTPHPDKTWRGDWFINYVHATAEVADAMLELDCWSLEEVEASFKWLLSKQNPDGGWGESALSYREKRFIGAESTVNLTTQVVMALVTYEKHYRMKTGAASPLAESLHQGVLYLLRSVDESPQLDHPAYSGVMVKSIWFINYELEALYRTIKVLGSYYELESTGLF